MARALCSSRAASGGGRGRGSGRGRGAATKVAIEEPSAEGVTGKQKEIDKSEESHPQEGGLSKWEQRLWADGFNVVAGTDEAGRGPLAGPVVAAAFAVLARDDEEVRQLLLTVQDSKQMTAALREDAYMKLTHDKLRGRVVWAVAEASAAEIDDGNILKASLGAMARAVQALETRPDYVLVDGCNRPPDLLAPGEGWTRGTKEERRRAEELKHVPKLSRWFTAAPKRQPTEEVFAEEPWRPLRVEAIISGDALVPSISAASVLAKVHRDRLMAKLHEEYPVYGFASHQGYGTAEHILAIKTHGPCPQHRRSFGPIREALGLDPVDDGGAAEALLGQQRLCKAFGIPAATSEAPPFASGVSIPTPKSGATPLPPKKRGGSSEDVTGKANETPPKRPRTAATGHAKKAQMESQSGVKESIDQVGSSAAKRRGRPAKAIA